MPTVHNPTAFDLFCVRLQAFIKAGQTIEVTDDDAAELAHGPVFIVAPAEPRSEPVRAAVKRGGKRAEVTRAPRRETRG